MKIPRKWMFRHTYTLQTRYHATIYIIKMTKWYFGYHYKTCNANHDKTYSTKEHVVIGHLRTEFM